jgi:hypothetical protein
VGQASSLSITDDGQDARPTGNLGFGGVPRHAGLRSASNDNLLPPVTEELPTGFFRLSSQKRDRSGVPVLHVAKSQETERQA